MKQSINAGKQFSFYFLIFHREHETHKCESKMTIEIQQQMQNDMLQVV